MKCEFCSWSCKHTYVNTFLKTVSSRHFDSSEKKTTQIKMIDSIWMSTPCPPQKKIIYLLSSSSLLSLQPCVDLRSFKHLSARRPACVTHLVIGEVDVPRVECLGRSRHHLVPDGLQATPVLEEALLQALEETLLTGARPVGDHTLWTGAVSESPQYVAGRLNGRPPTFFSVCTYVGRDTESLINAVRGMAGTVRQSQCSKGCSNPSHMLFPVWREL